MAIKNSCRYAGSIEHICPLCGELFWQVISREEAWKLYIKKLQDESECFLFTFTFFCVLCIKMDIEKLQDESECFLFTFFFVVAC